MHNSATSGAVNRVTFHTVQAARTFYKLRRAGLLHATAARLARLQHTYC